METNPGVVYAASTVLDDLIYIYGGDRYDCFDPKIKDISTLTASGKFTRLQTVGDSPYPRFYQFHQSWSYDGKIFFFGGQVLEKDKTREEEFVVWDTGYVEEGIRYNNGYFTKQLYQFDPRTRAFERLITTGEKPSPRINFSVAQFDHRVFIHGGFCAETHLSDFFVLNLETMA